MDVFEKSQTVDPEVRAYIYSLVSAVGGQSTLDDHYAIGDDALAVLNDLLRWLRLFNSFRQLPLAQPPCGFPSHLYAAGDASKLLSETFIPMLTADAMLKIPHNRVRLFVMVKNLFSECLFLCMIEYISAAFALIETGKVHFSSHR